MLKIQLLEDHSSDEASAFTNTTLGSVTTSLGEIISTLTYCGQAVIAGINGNGIGTLLIRAEVDPTENSSVKI